MPRKYSFADVNSDAKPLITRCERQFGDVVYTWHCAGRGSEGFGTTPDQAYTRWQKNWARRFRFYETRVRHSADVLHLFARVPADPSPKTKVCNRCGASGLHWENTEHGWRLFNPENQMHRCHKKAHQ